MRTRTGKISSSGVYALKVDGVTVVLGGLGGVSGSGSCLMERMLTLASFVMPPRSIHCATMFTDFLVDCVTFSFTSSTLPINLLVLASDP